MDNEGGQDGNVETRGQARDLDRGRYWVVYDGQCPFCRLSIDSLKLMDWWNLIEPVDLHRYAMRVLERIPALTREQLSQAVHMITPDDQVYEGFRVFRELTRLLPPLGPIAPTLHAPGADVAGQIAYEWVANHRHALMPCSPNGSCLR